MATLYRLSGLSGYIPALPTPFDASDEIDIAALERFCERQVNAGANAITERFGPDVARAALQDLLATAAKLTPSS